MTGSSCGRPCRPTPTSCTATPHETAAWTAHGHRSPQGASLADCRALIGDWLAGWQGQHSLHGPALIITAVSEPTLAGRVGLGDHGNRVVQIDYGIAPDRRGRGYATRAARLAARWLLHERHASLVELRIDGGNTASQRTALAAGFTPAGTVRSQHAGHRGNLPRPALRHAATLSRCHGSLPTRAGHPPKARYDRHGRKAVCQAVSGRR